MTFRIFHVSADGVASPVYGQDAPERPVQSASARTAPVKNTSPEWEELRERLRQQTTPKPSRKTWLGR